MIVMQYVCIYNVCMPDFLQFPMSLLYGTKNATLTRIIYYLQETVMYVYI